MSDELARLRAELGETEQALTDPNALPRAQRKVLLTALQERKNGLLAHIATLTGPGAIAQDSSVASGAQGLALGGGVQGNVSITQIHSYGVADLGSAPQTGPKVRHNLPHPDYVSFVGRKRELAQISELLAPGKRVWVIVIDGVGGVGKSALALEVAHHYLQKFGKLPEEERFHAIVWASAKPVTLTANGSSDRQRITGTLEEIQKSICLVLQRKDILGTDAEEWGSLVYQALSQQRTLLVLDNLETVDDSRVMDFVRDLPLPTKCMITTRQRIDVAYAIRLSEMHHDEAIELISQECEKKKVELTDADVDRLCRQTGGVPLAIVWSIGLMGYGHDAKSVLRRLGDAEGDIASFCFGAVMERIRDKPAHRLLMALSLFDAGASREAVGYVADLPELQRDEGLAELERISLVNRNKGLFTLLQLTRVWANNELYRHLDRNTISARYAEAVGPPSTRVSIGWGKVHAGTVQHDIYVGPPARDPAEALRIYRQVLVSACRRLPLRGVDVGASDPTGGQQGLELAQVYVDLDTKMQVPLTKKEKKGRERRAWLEERETRPLGVLEATIGNRHLVILGDPGSGKSAFVSYLAFCLAAQGLGMEIERQIRLPGWPEKEWGAVPISIVLRDFARSPSGDASEAAPWQLWDFIASRLRAQNLPFAVEPLAEALETGRAVVLLDGLDEVSPVIKRIYVRDAVAAFANRYPRSRVVVTCRTLSYQDPIWRLTGFPAFELASFDVEKVDHFIGAWYVELARLGMVKAEDADGLARRLREAVRRPDLWRLAPNPLLLTVMALVHTPE